MLNIPITQLRIAALCEQLKMPWLLETVTGAHLHIVQHEQLELLCVLPAQLRLAVSNDQLQVFPLHGRLEFDAVGLRKVRHRVHLRMTR